MIAVEKNQPATIQNANESIRDAPKLSKSEFLAHGGSPDTFVIAKASTQKED